MKGDWVRKLCKGGVYIPVKVLGVIENIVYCQSIDGKRYSVGEDCIERIPLTPEIIEKNDFELRKGCTSAWDWHHGESSVHIDGDHKSPILQTVTIYTPGGVVGAAFSSHRTLSEHKIRGVHELQHALRLCRIKKKISNLMIC